ncbi:odorant receptor 110N+C, partial [Diachasma alloeum]
MVEVNSVNLIITSIIKDVPVRTFPYRLWIPFNYTVSSYWVIYPAALTGITLASTFHVFHDAFITGLFLTLCVQLKILRTRITNKQIFKVKSIHKFLEHYNLLKQCAQLLNETIVYVIFMQYATSCFVVGLSVCRLVNMNYGDPAYLFTIGYYICLLLQTFYYCWFGNEVTVESSNIRDSIYGSEWYSLDKTRLRDIVMIMQRVSTPIQFSCTQLFVLSLDSFKQ